MTSLCEIGPKCGLSDLNRATKSQPQSETEIYLARLRSAREKAAMLIADGEEWLLPHFERIHAEIEKLEDKQKRLNLALEIARQAKERGAY
ncbi:hypothetical protein [Cohaesibacter intestini]|uniref:hypothetical protein n=1 Tax=Cohaesibacter intestini TaxID=2211145 RepID=UPI0013005B31|nr:hypothetical protein [Cohaesibacter intestini]